MTPKSTTKVNARNVALKMAMASFGFEEIDRFLIATKSAYIKEIEILASYHDAVINSNGLSEEQKSDFEFLDIPDQKYFLDEMQELSEQLSIIALYKKIEIERSRSIRLVFPYNKKSLSRIEAVEKFLKGKGIFLEKIKNYSYVNELRLINNCIKHGGLVSKELHAVNNKWVVGEKISGLQRTYNLLAPLCKEHFIEFLKTLARVP